MRKNDKKWTGKCLPVLMLTISVLLTGCIGAKEYGEMTSAGYKALENLDAATAYSNFSQAVASGEDAVMAYRGEGIAFMSLARYPEAVGAFENALSYTDDKMPDTRKDIRLYLASALYQMGEYSRTIAGCDEILFQDSTNESAIFLEGASYLQQNDQNTAKEYFDKAVLLTPKDYSLYLRIYECYEQKNLTAIGHEYLQQGLNIHPETVKDEYAVGRIYYYLGQYDAAKTALLRPVDEKYAPAMRLMGQIYLAMNDYAHASSIYMQVMESEGESPATYNGLALCEIGAGNYDTALSYITQGLALEGEEGKQQLRFNEIVVYEKKLDFATALVKAEAYTTLYPADAAGKKELQFLNTRGR